ncbi:unnamed protein product [Symbiodinium sp. CCMP2456]|nr:unnamed protein product [Symbiodinium sp. CCMP2456]
MLGNRKPWPDWRRKRARGGGRPKTVEPRVCKEEEGDWEEEEAEDPGSADWWPPFQPRQPRPPPGPPPDRWASWDDGDCEPESAPSTPSLASQSTSATSLPAAKPELGDSSSSEDELGQYLALLNKGPPKPKKMPKPKQRPPVSGASVATSKYPPPKRGPTPMAPPDAPEAPKRLRLEAKEPEKRTIIRPSTKAGPKPLPTSAKAPMAPAPPVVPSPIRPPLVSAPVQVTPANNLRIGRARTSVPVVPPRGQPRRTRETSTGLMVDPPPISELRDSRPCPFPGPPPVEDPPYWALQQPLLNSQLLLPPSHLPLALPAPPPPPPLDSQPESLAPAPMTDALALCEPSSGDGIISIDIDEDAIAVANVLQQDSQHAEFYEVLKEFQRKAAHVLKGSHAPVCIDVRLGGQITDLPDLALGAPSAPSMPSMPSQLALPSDTGSGDSGYYANNGNWKEALPSSFAAVRIVNAKDVRFSQKSMKRRFQDGRSLEELIQGLMRGTYNPMTDEFLTLTVVEKSDAQGNPALYSKDNRRLYCLHEYQRRICAERVPVRVRILAWQDVVDACKFQRNYDTEQDGTDITLRN